MSYDVRRSSRPPKPQSKSAQELMQTVKNNAYRVEKQRRKEERKLKNTSISKTSTKK